MDLSKFSLDYIRPTGIEKGSPVEQSDPWSKAVEFYGNPVLQTLQDRGQKTVDELYEITKSKANAPNLEFDQFAQIVERMVSDWRLVVVKRGDTFRDSVVALPVAAISRHLR